MTCYQIIIDARDRFFFRDARPISGSDIGDGASWPLPSVFHSAMLSALWERFPNTSQWESPHENLTEKEKKKHLDKEGKEKRVSNFRLGGLKTWGVFPVKKKSMENGEWNYEIFVPTPADIEPNGSVMRLISPVGNSNLPAPLKYLLANTSPPSKRTVHPWISLENLENYLRGKKVGETIQNSVFFDTETNPGIAIDPSTGSAEDGKFYQATYLRMKPDTYMLAFAECEAKKFNEKSGTDLLGIFFADKKSIPLIFGGQRGVAYMECKREKSSLCKLTDEKQTSEGTIVRWTLLSPAVFNNGWLPDWVDEKSGSVLLKTRPSKEGKSRKEWRAEIEKAPKMGASLVAARIPKPLVFSGWKLDIKADYAGGDPKATRLAVAPGTVYYFKCDNNDEAIKLANELHGNVKSSLLGEQGFGLGVCSILQKEELVVDKNKLS